MKGARLLVYVNDDGVIIGAKNVDPVTGVPNDMEIPYGPNEIAENKKFHGGKRTSRLLYTNPCCWRYVAGTGWVCQPC